MRLEDHLRNQLADLQRSYQRKAEPILRELALIEAAKPPTPLIVALADLRNFGVHITRDGVRVDPADFYMEKPDDDMGRG